jgi:MFS family permease
MYNVLFATKDIGVSVELYGKIMGIGSIIAMVAVFFMGKIMDKFHPMFLYIYGGILIIITNIFGYFFVYTPLTFGVIGIVTALMYAIQGVAGTPLLVNMLPMDKFGQFASANSMVNSIVVILGAYLGGYLTDLFGYRVMFVWDFTVTSIAMTSMLLVYLQWKKLGGRNYVPPTRKVID